MVSTGDHGDVSSAVLFAFPPFFGWRNQRLGDCLTAEIIFITLAKTQQLKEPKTSFLPSTKRNAWNIESCFRAILKGWVTMGNLSSVCCIVVQFLGKAVESWFTSQRLIQAIGE